MMLCLSPGPQTEDQALTTLPWTETKLVLVIWPQTNLAFLPVVFWNWDPLSLVGMLQQLEGRCDATQ